jgi:hypothetical protein
VNFKKEKIKFINCSFYQANLYTLRTILSPRRLRYVANRLPALKRAPNLRKANGIGIMSAAKHPSNVAAHCTPRFANICFENSGNAAATAERRMMFAATADAALYFRVS